MRCLNSPTIPVQAATSDPDSYYTELTRVLASPMLRFSGKQGQCGSRESCILLESGPTRRSLVPRALQHSSLAVRKFCTASKECCGRGYDQCVQTLLRDVVPPETLITATVCMSSNCKLSTHHTKILHGGRLHGGP